MCAGVRGCVHLSTCMRVRVCVSVFMHLCLCVSKGVYAVQCRRAHFPLLHVCTYIVVCMCELLSACAYFIMYVCAQVRVSVCE